MHIPRSAIRTTRSEVAILQDVQIDEAPGIRPRSPYPADESEHQRYDGPAHPNRSEPVVFLALVEHDLQAACPNDEEAKADVVEGSNLGVLDVGRVVDEAGDHEDGERADGDVDVEGVAPGVGVGEPASEGGAEHRRDDDAESVGGHRLGTFGGRKAFEQDGLRQRLQRAASCALKNARKQDDRERWGGSAEERCDGEDDELCPDEAGQHHWPPCLGG